VDVADDTAEETGLVTDDTAEGTGVAEGAGIAGVEAETEGTDGVTADGGVVAACACLEKTSRITKIPAARIASCTARRATWRAIGSGTGNSRSVGRRGSDFASSPAESPLNRP
jgi:hypothetical protein